MIPLPRSSFVRIAIAVLVAAMVAVAAGACGAMSGGSAGPSAGATADPAVATVNGNPLRASLVEVVRAERRFVGKSDAMAAALNEAIDRELVRQEAERLGVDGDAAKVRARSTNLADQMGGAAALKSALAKASMTEAQLRQSLEDGVLRQSLQDAKFAPLVAPEESQRAYYHRHRDDLFTQAGAVHLGAITVPAEKIAENAISRLVSGHPFVEVARQFSTDLEAKANGGDLGWVLESSLPAPLRKAAAALSKDAVSKPVAAFGRWYVLKLEGRRAARVIPYAKVRGRIQQELTRVKRAKALAAWLAAARRDATVTTP